MKMVMPNKNVCYYIYPLENSEQIFIELIVKVGSNRDGKIKGIAHFLEHMLLGFDRALESVCVHYDNIWGKTGFNSTSYKVEVKDGKEDEIKDCLAILRDIYMGKTLNEDFYGMVLNDIFDEFEEFLLKKEIHILERLSNEEIDLPIGDKGCITNLLNYEKLLDFFNNYYAKSSIAIVVTGKVTYKKIEQMIFEIFGKIMFSSDSNRNVESRIIGKSYCYYNNNSENKFFVKRPIKNYNLKKRAFDDVMFIIAEEIIGQAALIVMQKKCEVNVKRLLYDKDRQYICIEINENSGCQHGLDSWNKVAKESYVLIKKMLNKKNFEKLVYDYYINIEKSSEMTCEEYINEAKNDFLFGMEIYHKHLYLDCIKAIHYEMLYESLVNLIADFEISMRNT